MALDAIKEKLKSAYSRIVLNRITVVFIVLSFVLCLVQGIIQSLLFTVDSQYSNIFRDIVQIASSPSLNRVAEISSEFHIHDIRLSLCQKIPVNAEIRAQSCSVVFDAKQSDPTTSQLPISMNQTTVFLGEQVVIGETCAQTLVYAHQTLRDFSSEDLTFIFLQFWLFGISVLAVTNDSVAHLLTALLARALVTAWSIYSLWRTNNFVAIFQKLYVDPGTPCSRNFFSGYFKMREAYQVPDLVLTALSFFIACWLSWKLLRMYNTQALRYVGAPERINRINKLFLAVLSCLQLEAFIILAAMGLWVDVLRNTAIGTISSYSGIYLGLFIFTSLMLIPWISLGWYSIRREMKRAILLFIFLAFALLVLWSVMFYSSVYTWIIRQWPFLAGCSACSLFLIVSSTVLAIICRLNFGKGLKQYLQAEAALAKSGFAPEVFRHDEEKNTPLDIGTPDLKQSSFSPISPTEKYEYPLPTYLASLPSHNRSGSVEWDAAEGRRVNALEAPLPVSRLAERSTRVPMHGASYDVKLGESF